MSLNRTNRVRMGGPFWLAEIRRSLNGLFDYCRSLEVKDSNHVKVSRTSAGTVLTIKPASETTDTQARWA